MFFFLGSMGLVALNHQDLGPESAPRARELCALKLAGVPSWKMLLNDVEGGIE